MFHLLNHEFNNQAEPAEIASDMLAGGIAQKGHQCGMLWGSSLACGTEAFKRAKSADEAAALAINASQKLVESFTARTKSPNCRDIAKVDWENKFDFVVYMFKTLARGLVFSPCFNLIVKWTPESVEAAKAGLSARSGSSQACLSCASETVKKMGANEEEAAMVAGFAGGIGLSGNACGALAAAIWYKMLLFAKQNKGKAPSMFNNPDAKKILRSFYMQTDSEMLCENICQKKFSSAEDHSEYITNGGCKNIIEALANS